MSGTLVGDASTQISVLFVRALVAEVQRRGQPLELLLAGTDLTPTVLWRDC